MSISLKIDTYLLCSMFNISTKKLDTEYAGMPIEEIMAAEAKQGNTAAANFDSSVLSDPAKLIELFELNSPSNKYAILSNMNESDLSNLLPSLGESDLIQGLNYFSKDKLLSMIQGLPKKELLHLAFNMFSDAHIMQMMPEDQLNKMLASTDMDKNQELSYLQTINPQVMAQMIEAATGQPAAGAENVGLDGQPNYDVGQMLNQITNLSDNKFQGALLSMPKESKEAFLYRVASQNPKLYESVDSSAYTDMIDAKKDKQDIIRYANVIDEKQLTKMVSQLPKDLMAVVLTQVDTSKFANVLLANFKDILSQIIAG